MAEYNEPSLIVQAQRDPQAFAQLYDRYVDRIFAYTFRQTGDEALAQDVNSATFEKAVSYFLFN
jgi:RNA polymerase sigma-70 factor (ECF subfamily)